MTPTLAGASKSPERSWPSARTRVKVLHQRRYQNMLPWPFQIPLRNGLCSLKFSLKQTPGVHKRYGKLMLSMECKTLFCASFTQETRSWLWPMLPRWRLAPARYEASLRRTQRTLSKWSGRSFQRFSSGALFFFTSSVFHRCKHLCPPCADSLLGFLCLWGNGRDRGVAAGRPTHLASDAWTQSRLQLEGDANAGLKEVFTPSSVGSPQLLNIYFNPHCCTSPKKAHPPCFRQRQACRHLCF